MLLWMSIAAVAVVFVVLVRLGRLRFEYLAGQSAENLVTLETSHPNAGDIASASADDHASGGQKQLEEVEPTADWVSVPNEDVEEDPVPATNGILISKRSSMVREDIHVGKSAPSQESSVSQVTALHVPGPCAWFLFF